MKQSGLIIFFIPAKKLVNGGVMSIFSLCKESRRFYDIHKSEVVISTFPGADTYLKNDLFKNDELIYSFDQIIKKWPRPEKLIIHIPENAVVLINESLAKKRYQDYIKTPRNLHINVMTQNIDLISNPVEFAELYKFTPNVTQTTAHDKYTTQELSNKYQTPVHHLSVYVDQRQYEKISYEKKENLIIYSPDDNPEKEKVLNVLKKLTGFRTLEVKNLSYENYKKLTAKAKFAITFREGFDAYFSESFFSGSIGCAVYNDRFFPNPGFKELPTVFNSYDEMAAKLKSLIDNLDNKSDFEKVSSAGLRKLNEIQKFERYIEKIKNFYLGNYDILPESNSASQLLENIMNQKDRLVNELTADILEKESEIKSLNKIINGLIGSISWKITGPLRKLNSFRK